MTDKQTTTAGAANKVDYIDLPHLHTPKVDIVFPPGIEKYADLQCKGDVLYTNMPESHALDTFFESFNPKTAIELGCGIGRGSVYLFKRYGLTNTHFVMYDGDSGDETLFGADRKGTQEFYNSLEATRTYCEANGMGSVEIVNAETTGLLDIPHKFDLAYSFLAIGFHWGIDLYLDELSAKMNSGGLCMFGMQGNDKSDGEQFTRKQISSVNPDKWNILLNYRQPHYHRMSVLVLQRL